MLTTLGGSLWPGRYLTFSWSVLMMSVSFLPSITSSNTHMFTVVSKPSYCAAFAPTILAMADPLMDGWTTTTMPLYKLRYRFLRTITINRNKQCFNLVAFNGTNRTGATLHWRLKLNTCMHTCSYSHNQRAPRHPRAPQWAPRYHVSTWRDAMNGRSPPVTHQMQRTA